MARNAGIVDVMSEHLRRNLAVLALVTLVFTIGVLFGASYSAVMTEWRSEIHIYLRSGLESLARDAPMNQGAKAMSSIQANLSTAGVIWLLGISVVGFPGILVVLFLRGFSLGFTVCFMVRELSVPGVAAAFTSILPHNLISIPTILLLGTTSMSFSLSVFRRRVLGQPLDTQVEFLKSGIAAGMAGVALSLSSLIQAYVSPALLIVAARFMG